jgi:hypothetical protein
MGDCDAVEGHMNKYFQANAFYTNVASDRHYRFLRRHQLMQQFLDEDAQGLR